MYNFDDIISMNSNDVLSLYKEKEIDLLEGNSLLFRKLNLLLHLYNKELFNFEGKYVYQI